MSINCSAINEWLDNIIIDNSYKKHHNQDFKNKNLIIVYTLTEYYAL